MEKTKIVSTILVLGFVALLLSGTFAYAESDSIFESTKVSTETSTMADTRAGENEGPTETSNEDEGPTETSINYVDIVISPEKQESEDGSATYEVIIYDDHMYAKTQEACSPDGPCPIIEAPRYVYNLYFNSEQNINGEFDNNQVTVYAGSKSVVKLKVQAKDKGTSIFSVTAKGEESKDSAKGLIIFGEKENPKPEPTSYFKGKGFALSTDKSKGFLGDIHLLRDGNSLKGKIKAGNSDYKVEGTISGENVKFEIFSQNGEEEATFIGTIKEYDSFLLLEGDISTSETSLIWHFTAFSQKENVFIDIDQKTEEPTVRKVKMKEVITITSDETKPETGEKKEVYVQPVEVKNGKFLWIIPTGEKKIEVNIINEGRSTKIDLNAFEEKTVEGYNVKVGSLENSEEIEVTIEKAP